MSQRVTVSLLLAATTFAGCSGDEKGPELSRPSKSSTIDITSDDSLVAMTNPEDDSVSIFRVSDESRIAKVPTGDEPSSVVFHPDGKTLFVANRAAATVVKIVDANTAPVPDGSVDVGSEPTGLALSPSGKKLFVAEFAEGRVSVIDTDSMKVIGTIDSPLHPRALAVTNNLDGNDDDETLVVPEFYGEPVPGGEAKDDGRQGRVRLYAVSNLAPKTAITLAPIDSGFAPDGSPEGTPTVKTSPNQLYSVAIRGTKVYVTSVSASPERPIKFNTNVQPVVYVANLTDSTEDRSGAGTTNLARLVKQKIPEGTRHFLADVVDLAFFGPPDNNVAYAVARGADVVQRIVYNDASVEIGSANNVQIDILGGGTGCKNPIGVVGGNGVPKLFVNCWVSRNLAIVNLAEQTLARTLEASPAPSGNEAAINDGRRFYFTGRGRWSKESWSSCGSCHPDGLSDNVTWVFGTGPRQTTSMDGSFSKGPGTPVQRVFNWTAINDEVHDFERNTRDVSNGLGAVTIAAEGGSCGVLAEELRDPENLAATTQLSDPVKELVDRQSPVKNCVDDWNRIDQWVATIRPPKALKTLDPAAVERGKELFSANDTANNGGCVKCHGGPGWTASRRFYIPEGGAGNTNEKLLTAEFVPPILWPDEWNRHVTQVAFQPAGVDPGFAGAIPVNQVACVLRNVGTFGLPGDATATDALEQRAAPFGPDSSFRSQGAGGFNVPSLYGLALGAPYLHHGQAKSLEELFTDSRWNAHLIAGNPNFKPTEAQRGDLIAFLLSIDAATPEQDIPDGFDGCPLTFSAK
jgi:YVTN family beta-propeller protein